VFIRRPGLVGSAARPVLVRLTVYALVHRSPTNTMEKWKKITIMVTAFTFFLQIRPLDSFLTAYLTGPNVNATLNEVTDVFTPIKLYTSVVSTFLVFLLADYLRYKPLVVFNGMVGMATYLCLIGKPSIFSVKLSEVFGSLVLSCEWTYYGYLFARIKDKNHYQIATGCVKAGALSGQFISGLFGQLVTYLNNSDYNTLPYYSIIGVTIATALAIMFPPIKRKIGYFHADNTLPITVDEKANLFSKHVICNSDLPKYSTFAVKKENVDCKPATKIKSPFACIYENFKNSYANPVILRWSLWHVLGLTGYIQVRIVHAI